MYPLPQAARWGTVPQGLKMMLGLVLLVCPERHAGGPCLSDCSVVGKSGYKSSIHLRVAPKIGIIVCVWVGDTLGMVVRYVYLGSSSCIYLGDIQMSEARVIDMTPLQPKAKKIHWSQRDLSAHELENLSNNCRKAMGRANDWSPAHKAALTNKAAEHGITLNF